MDNTLKPDAENAAQKILDLEQMIKGYLTDITAIREKLKTQRDMHNSTFEQDKEYSDIDEEHTKVKRKQAEVKQRLAKTDAVAAVQTTMKGLKDELKDVQGALSSYLNQYASLTNSNQFTGADGEIHEIVHTANLVRKKA